MIRRQDSIEYHSGSRPGKIELRATKPCNTPRDLRLAYLPGASFPTMTIASDPAAAYRLTARGNLVGVVSNGTAVPGGGNVGALAAKPMLEGMAVLLKRFADIDVFDLELDTSDPERFVEAVALLEPTFGAVNLKDIRAPEGLLIYEALRSRLKIPVFHENLYSTAVVASAALLNALDLVGKRIGDIRLVMCGAGTVGTGCARLFRRLGVRDENLLVYDRCGLVHPGRTDLHDYQREYARDHAARTLAEALRGADVFVGVSAGGVLDAEMVRSMARFPVVFALATPDPEIPYDEARGSRQDVIVATGLGQYPNAVLDVLSVPYVLRGALDIEATAITEGMLLAAARALADLAREDVPPEVVRAYGQENMSFGPTCLLPRAIDPRILVRESAAVAEQAVKEGVAGRPLDTAAHQESLAVRIGTGRETMRGLMLRARREPCRVVFAEGGNEAVLRACGIILDEEIASPILLGPERAVRESIERLGLDLSGVPVVEPERSPRYETYVEEFFRMRRRRGVMRSEAARRVARPDTFAAMMVDRGDADMVIAGSTSHYVEALRTILTVIGPAAGVRRVSSAYLVLLPKDVVVLADCAVNVDPDSEDLAEIALLAAATSRALGIDPRVAMLSFSNFGSAEHPRAEKVRRAVEIAKAKAPDLVVDGEMQLPAARDAALRREYFPFSSLTRDANVLIFPDLGAGSLTMYALHYLGEAIPIGPVLMGTSRPAHVLQYGATVEEIVNLTTVGVVQAAARRSPAAAKPV